MHFNNLTALVALALTAQFASAQVVIKQDPYSLTVEAYANLSAAHSQGEDKAPKARREDARVDAGLRLLGVLGPREGTRFGARVELLSTNEDAFEVGERSLLATGPWGRLELGKRRGLPDVLAGYAPNGFTFTSAEFGLGSGRGLDPGGDLPTSFLSPGLAAQINAISSLGFVATLAGDRSGKVIYVSPKLNGFEGGVSYSPRASELGGRFKHLFQGGLVHESYFGEDVLRVGGSFTHASGSGDALLGNAFGELNSLSGGATLGLNNELDLGISATYDGHSGLQHVSAPSFRSDGLGVVASANFNTGPWTVGAYVQQAKAEGDPAIAGRDALRAWQLGASYRLTTQLRFYIAHYGYGFHNEAGRSAADRFGGSVLLIGTRIAL